MTSFLFGFDNQIVSLVYQLVSANDHMISLAEGRSFSWGSYLKTVCGEKWWHFNKFSDAVFNNYNFIGKKL